MREIINQKSCSCRRIFIPCLFYSVNNNQWHKVSQGNRDISVEEVILSGNADGQIIAGNRAPRANTTFPLSVI